MITRRFGASGRGSWVIDPFSAIGRNAVTGAAEERVWVLVITGDSSLILALSRGEVAVKSWSHPILTDRGSIAQLLAYHYFNQTGIAFYAPAQQQEHWWRRSVSGGWLWGDSVNPVDPTLTLTTDPDGGYRLNRYKRFSTGSGVGEVIIVNAVVADGEQAGKVLAFVLETDRKGIELVDDWNHLGQRLTASGSVRYSQVRVNAEDILGELSEEPISTLLIPGLQLAFAHLYVGIAQGALAKGRDILLNRQNSWFLAGVDSYSRDVIFQRTIGELKARVAAAEALADKLARRYDAVISLGGEVTSALRADVAVAIAELKVVSTEVGLETAHRIFEITGSSSTNNEVGLDLYWRNVRTHTLHDPVDYKKIEVGQYYLHGEPQPISLYT
ncbi:acyl-CoA dehydrogenase family protein [Glutamicibacter uratoxydans]|uniref:acyl-CoA dehydrogenase family protein n=1 Tax=Glutamicibacter uratoxydans TaxID=43667 RepID=UPI003D6FA416